MSRFFRYIGIDYSGAETPTSGLKGLRVFAATGAAAPEEILPPPSARRYWTRQGLTEWLVATLRGSEATIVGIDHAFSFPLAYFDRHSLPHDWHAFLDDFCAHWPTADDNMYVDFVRDGLHGNGVARTGETRWRRVTDRAAGGAKSPFHFDVQGSVAKSTHAGIPWLKHLRDQLGKTLHFWRFDGWTVPPGVHVIAEVYPSLWRSRYPLAVATPDQQDAYAACRAMQDADQTGVLVSLLSPALSPGDRSAARFEGWILGALPTDSSPPARKREEDPTDVPQPLFSDLLRPKLEKEGVAHHTYWEQLTRLHRSLHSCPPDWIEKLDSGEIRRRRQIEKDEPTITYYLFAALSLATREFTAAAPVNLLCRKAFRDTAVAEVVAAHVRSHGWSGLQFEALLTPTDAIREAVERQLDENPVPYVRVMGKNKAGVRFESATHLDAFVGDGRRLTEGHGYRGLGVEAKFTSDIDDQTTYAPHRNQLIRNIEVGNARFSEFAFLLVTPRAYRVRRSRFYVCKMEEYLGPSGAEALNRDSLTKPGLDTTGQWQERLGWIDWEDLVAAAFPSGVAASDHHDMPRLIDFLRVRLLWPFAAVSSRQEEPV